MGFQRQPEIGPRHLAYMRTFCMLRGYPMGYFQGFHPVADPVSLLRTLDFRWFLKLSIFGIYPLSG